MAEKAEKGLRTSDPVAIAEERADTWRKLWQRGSRQGGRIQLMVQRLRTAALVDVTSWETITGGQVRMGFRKLAGSTGRSLEGLDPVLFKMMPNHIRYQFAEGLNFVEETMVWPRQAMVVHTALLDKDSTSDRLISLMIFLVRIWNHIRVEPTAEWEAANVLQRDGAAKGRGVTGALFRNDLDIELAVVEGAQVLEVLLDMTKFYDGISISDLLADAVPWHYPLVVVVLCAEQYLAIRCTR